MFFFFFNDTATTEIYTLSLHDALPICKSVLPVYEELNSLLFYPVQYEGEELSKNVFYTGAAPNQQRSEEHTSELQSRRDLVCRLLLEKKKKKQQTQNKTKHTNQSTKTH